ncbi:hypothetical protein EUA76_01000 [TM7 phylum sp. oral taxon 350]|nr:hypothetical protein EUA76_01000 [TM7 phylum sp. oral taxon 350]
METTSDSNIRWKKTSNELLAVIYKELVLDYMREYLSQNGLYDISDYIIIGVGYGDVVYIALKTFSKKTCKISDMVHDSLNKHSFSFKEIERAIKRISIEYRCPVVEVKKSVVDKIKKIHDLAWNLESELGIFKANDLTSDDIINLLSDIKFSKRDEKAFKKVSPFLKADNLVYKNNPAKKALAIFVIRVVLSEIRRELKKILDFYDDELKWDEGYKIVECDLNSFMYDESIDVEKIEKFFKKIVETLAKNEDFIKSIKLALTDFYEESVLWNFSIGDFHRISGGIVIGRDGFKNVATEENIKEILENMWAWLF